MDLWLQHSSWLTDLGSGQGSEASLQATNVLPDVWHIRGGLDKALTSHRSCCPLLNQISVDETLYDKRQRANQLYKHTNNWTQLKLGRFYTLQLPRFH